MDCLKTTQQDDNSIIGTTPECKSWVKSRFTTVFDNGIAKRRCLFNDCNKEYAKTTSHMILKRHWSRDHDDLYSMSPRSKAANTNPNTATTTNNNNSTNDVVIPMSQSKQIARKKPLKASNNSSTRGTTSGLNNNNNSTNNDTNHEQSHLTPTKSIAGGNINNNINTKQNNFINNNNNHNLIVNNIANNKQYHNAGSMADKFAPDVKKVARRLKEAKSIHITFDIHTPKKGAKTLGIVTAHSLSTESFEIKSVILDYKHLPFPDDSTCLYEFLRSCVTKFTIREKIISIASNCSGYMNSAVQELDKRLRLSKNFNFSTVCIKCFPQFVHLNVIDTLRSEEHLIDNVRKVISFINNNNFTVRSLEQTGDEAHGGIKNTQNAVDNLDSRAKTSGLKLPLDNRNSWNTTYNMIDTFVQQRAFIEPTFVYMQHPQDLSSTNIDWDRLYTIVRLLKPFYEAVNKFSSDNYAPVSLVAASIPHLMDHLSGPWVYQELEMAAQNFKNQFESYRQLFQSDLTVIAGLLDPRIKDTFISPEAKQDAIEILRKRLKIVKNESVPNYKYSDDSLWSHVFRPHGFDEVADYLESPREHGQSCNIAFWEAHKHVYPTLYALAKTLVCVQSTSVPGDRMFSSAEPHLREARAHNEPATNREIVKSWSNFLKKVN